MISIVEILVPIPRSNLADVKFNLLSEGWEWRALCQTLWTFWRGNPFIKKFVLAYKAALRASFPIWSETFWSLSSQASPLWLESLHHLCEMFSREGHFSNSVLLKIASNLRGLQYTWFIYILFRVPQIELWLTLDSITVYL